MMKLKVVKVDPLELPSDIVWKISGIQKISLKDFVLYIDNQSDKMYVNKSAVPKKDITKIVNLATSEKPYILDDGTEDGDFMEYVYEKYGWEAYNSICDYHKAKMKKLDEQDAKNRLKEVLPLIEEITTSEFPVIPYNEYLIYEVFKKGGDAKRKTPRNVVGYNDIYVFYLGCLVGMGKVKKDDWSLSSGDNVLDYYYEICDMLEHIDVREMPRIHGYLKEMYFPEVVGGDVD